MRCALTSLERGAIRCWSSTGAVAVSTREKSGASEPIGLSSSSSTVALGEAEPVIASHSEAATEIVFIHRHRVNRFIMAYLQSGSRASLLVSGILVEWPR